jgi:hypothetical protein
MTIEKSILEVLKLNMDDKTKAKILNILLLNQTETTDDKDNLSPKKEEKILSLYQEMIENNSLSLNQIALKVFGKKGGYYNVQIKEVLSKHGIEI